MVRAIRHVQVGLGNGRKQPAAAEEPNRHVARRSIVAGRAIAAGEELALDMLSFKRPGTGLSPMDVWSLLGRKASRDYAADEQIEP
jgi:N-acetylneuraminate synthase